MAMQQRRRPPLRQPQQREMVLVLPQMVWSRRRQAPEQVAARSRHCCRAPRRWASGLSGQSLLHPVSAAAAAWTKQLLSRKGKQRDVWRTGMEHHASRSAPERCRQRPQPAVWRCRRRRRGGGARPR